MVRAASIQTYYVFMCSLKGKNKYRYVTNYCCWCVVMADAPDRECTRSSGMVMTRWVKEDSSQVCDKAERVSIMCGALLLSGLDSWPSNLNPRNDGVS